MYPQIMGILNFTPDSFSDGGKYFDPLLATAHTCDMCAQGADIIDLGCNSTRPGSRILDCDEELERLKSVLPYVIDKCTVPLSVDTFYYECAEYALNNGVTVINDVSGIFNESIAHETVKYGASYIVTHNSGGADNVEVFENGITASVNTFFDICIEKAAKLGIQPGNLWLDPGFGFGKSREDNYLLLKNLRMVKHDGFPLLAGISRKRFIRDNNPEDSDYATAAANAYALSEGADIIRVHNVRAAFETRRVIAGLRGYNNG